MSTRPVNSWLLVALTITLAAGRAPAAPTPAQLCQAAKNKEAAKYASCRLKAEAVLATTGGGAKYTLALARCAAKLQAKWPVLEAAAVARNGVCPSVGDESAIQDAIDVHTTNVATALGGGPLLDCPADLATCDGDLTTCTTDLGSCSVALGTTEAGLTTCQGDLAACLGAPQAQRLRTGQTSCYDDAGLAIACAGTGQDGELLKGTPSGYLDNGDGTITDTKTGLMWEKLSDDGTIHDKDAAYTWTAAVLTKVATLNANGFAGFSDWRVPNVNELQSLVRYGAAYPAVDPAFDTGCAASCTVLTCSCTQSNIYWSSSTYLDVPSIGWAVYFNDGYVVGYLKVNNGYVRAVRGG